MRNSLTAGALALATVLALTSGFAGDALARGGGGGGGGVHVGGGGGFHGGGMGGGFHGGLGAGAFNGGSGAGAFHGGGLGAFHSGGASVFHGGGLGNPGFAGAHPFQGGAGGVHMAGEFHNGGGIRMGDDRDGHRWHRAYGGYGALAGLGFASAYGYPYYGDSGYAADYGYDNSYAYEQDAPNYVVAQQSSPGEDVAYCVAHFKSYDPASGTYLGYDGMRHPCPE
jgi:BA14K-like protein